MAKSYVVFAVDNGDSMLSGSNALDLCIALARSQVTQMLVNKKSTEFGLVCFGQSIHSNEHVSPVLISCEKPKLSFLDSVDNLSAIRTRQSDISHGFRDGFDMLSKVRVTPSSQRLFVVLTDGETAVSNFEYLEKQVEKFSPTAGDPPIHLQIIMIGKVSMSSTIHKIENSKLFQSIADSCLGRFDQAETLADCLSFIASAPVLSTTPRATSIPLIVTPFLKFSCVYWSQVSKVSAPSLKKQLKSALSEFGGSTAKRDTSYRNPDDPDEEIFSEDRVKGFKYGSQFVPISGVEEEAFKLQGVNEIKVIGFVSKSRIPRHHYLEASIALQCNESRGFVALSSQMRNEGLVALARFVKKANGDPALVALIPSEFNPGLLCIQRLPVCEDYREYSFPSLPTGKQTPNSKLKPEQVDAVTSLVDELTIPALPTQFLSPVNSEIRNIHLLVEHRLRKSCGAPKTLPSPFIRLVSSSDKVDGAIHEVLNAFDLRARSGSKEKKRSYWSDILIQGDESKKARGIQEISVSSEGELPGTAPSFVEESSLHVGVETVAPELSVGSVSPVEDFGAVIAHYKQLMNAHDASSLAKDSALFAVKSAMVTFGEIITLLVSVGGSNAHYRKAMACLKVYRSTAIEFGESRHFNAFIRNSIKVPFSSGRFKPFWDLVVGENEGRGVTLISTVEDISSDSTPEDAFLFLLEEKAASLPAAVIVAQDEEDLFEDMA